MTWETLLARPDGAWSADLPSAYAAAQERRAASPVKVGSICAASMRLLRSLCVGLQPQVIAEIGTGLGASTTALQAGRVIYTCDKNHDLLTASAKVKTFPKQLSTTMLSEMLQAGLSVDLFFFDGRILPSDVPLILALSHASTAYVVDDYLRSERRAEKGMANIELLAPRLPRHQLVMPTQATWNPIAALLPVAVLAQLQEAA